MLFIVSVCDALASDDGSGTSCLLDCCAAFGGLIGLQGLFVAYVRWWFDWDYRDA